MEHAAMPFHCMPYMMFMMPIMMLFCLVVCAFMMRSVFVNRGFPCGFHKTDSMRKSSEADSMRKAMIDQQSVIADLKRELEELKQKLK